MAKGRVDQLEKQKRIYQVGLLLKRKPIKYIVQLSSEKWGVTPRQVRKYIRLAKKEWAKYFANLKSSGRGYHIAQMRDLKDSALVAGDLKLAFEIIKEEAKLMEEYPAEKMEPLRVILESEKEGKKKTDGNG